MCYGLTFDVFAAEVLVVVVRGGGRRRVVENVVSMLFSNAVFRLVNVLTDMVGALGWGGGGGGEAGRSAVHGLTALRWLGAGEGAQN